LYLEQLEWKTDTTYYSSSEGYKKLLNPKCIYNVNINLKKLILKNGVCKTLQVENLGAVNARPEVEARPSGGDMILDEKSR